MAKKKDKNKFDPNGFIVLEPIKGGNFDKYLQKYLKKHKLPKKPDKYIKNPDKYDIFKDKYSTDAIENMTKVGIGDYVYENGFLYITNVNVGRNIPWIQDGLKSVERRILYTMMKLKLYNGKFDRVAAISGDMIANVHPHGDMSINSTIYRLGRKHTIMHPYIKAGGNFGNMDDMEPAAPRYASASLSKYTMDCFFSEMGTKYPIYDTKPNYKYSDVEPVFLTSRYPNILMQWNPGVTKGAYSLLCAFNSKDIFDTTLKLLDDPFAKVDIYPDYSSPVQIVNKKDLKGCFDKSVFKVKFRAPYKVVLDQKRNEHGKTVDKYTIVFTALPIGTNGEIIKGQIIKNKQDDIKKSNANKKFSEILNIEIITNDKTDGGIELIIEYEKGFDPDALAQKLYSSTDLEKTVSVNFTLVNNNRIEKYTPREILNIWISQRFDQKRRYFHQLALKAAKDRARLEAICTILDSPKNIDIAIKIIRGSKDSKEAIAGLMKRFGFSDYQASCIIEIRLQNLAKISISETVKSRDEALESYKKYRKILSDEKYLREYIKDELEDGRSKYGYERMTPLINTSEKDKVIDRDNYIFYNDTTYFSIYETAELKSIKKFLDKTYRFKIINTSNRVLVVAKNGTTRLLEGSSFTKNVTGIDVSHLGLKGELCDIIPIKKDVTHIALITATGYAKIIDIEEATRITKSKMMILSPEDSIVAAIPISGTNNGYIALSTNNGICFVETSSLPVMKRASGGTRLYKFGSNLITSAYHIPSTAKHIMIYAEFGNVKVYPVGLIKINKKKPVYLTMGKYVHGIYSIDKANEYIDIVNTKGVNRYALEVGTNMLKLVYEDDVTKFKMGTTIGNPVKVFPFGRNEFYIIYN